MTLLIGNTIATAIVLVLGLVYIIGLDRKIPLKGIQMTSPDIRAGVSLLIAALSANGTSTINNIEQIDRGYQNIDTRLQKLGADIRALQVVVNMDGRKVTEGVSKVVSRDQSNNYGVTV